jgi:hypothetical protein
LKILWLSRTAIGNAGASALALALKQNKIIDVLNLDNNEIGCRGAIDIADALYSLKQIVLRATEPVTMGLFSLSNHSLTMKLSNSLALETLAKAV